MSFFKVPISPGVAPLLGDMLQLKMHTPHSHILWPSSSAQKIPLNDFFHTFFARDSAIVQVQVQNGDFNILSKHFWLKSRCKMSFSSC